jgi:SAM-dependent methyltransferase
MVQPAAEPRTGQTRFATNARPNRSAALDQYRSRASVYDLELVFARPIRERAVALLALKPGDIVIDVGCGTGLSFAMVEEGIGRGGRIIAIEQSPEMIKLAAARASRSGWDNISFLRSPVEEAQIPTRADGALFHFTHDILQTRAAVDNVMRGVKSGGRVVSAGLKWAPRWLPAVNALVRIAAWRSTTTTNGLDKPWRELERYLRGLEVEQAAGGGIYLACGVAR